MFILDTKKNSVDPNRSDIPSTANQKTDESSSSRLKVARMSSARSPTSTNGTAYSSENLVKICQIQWGLKYQTSLVFGWLIVVQF